MVRQLEVDGLGGTDIMVNKDRITMKEKLERLLKSETEGRVSHGYNSNENIVLGQGRENWSAIFENIANIHIDTEHDSTGLVRWTYIIIQCKEDVSRICSAHTPCQPSKALGGYLMIYDQQKYGEDTAMNSDTPGEHQKKI